MMFDGVAVSATTATADATHTDAASHTTASVSVAHTDTTTAAATTTAETSKTTSGTTAVTSNSTSSASNTTTQDTSKTSAASVVSGTSSASGPQVVFVESDVKDYQSLINQLPSGYEVVVLDSSKDGLAQIAAWASAHSGYSAMHILSHGEKNDLMLGTMALNSANIANYESELATIGQALSADGDILLYGCSIAQGSDGAALIGALAKDTQHAVAGSTDPTGAAALGGNWTLEYSTDKLHVAALDLVGYDGLLTRPTSGTTFFDSLDGSLTVIPNGQSSITAPNYMGWDFTMQMNSPSDGANEMIIVEKDGSSTVETVDALSDGLKQITYFSVKSNDGSLFTLNSIGVVVNGYDSAFSGGTVTLTGYLNGSAVSGASLTLNVNDIYNSGNLVTFNVSSNSAFQDIDSFRVTAANGHTITGLIGIGAINATNFHFPGPVLTTSGGSTAYSSGTGNAVAIDSGITLTDTAASTLTSATIAITGNFHSGEDVLAFSNTNTTTYGNIIGSYNSATGLLTLTSSGSTATTAQWQAALKAVTYQDSSLSPNTSSRTLSFTITDASSNTSSTVTRIVTVAADVAPVISNLNGDSGTFYAGGTAVHLDSGTAATVTDSDTTSFNGGNLTVQITANGHSAEDVLGIDTSGTVTASNGTTAGSVISVGGVAIGSIATNGDGINGDNLSITFNANATASRVSTLVGALTYYNSATTPTTGNRTIQVVVNDGRGQTSSTSSVTIAMNNNALVTTSGGSAAFTSGDNSVSTPVVIDSGLSIVDHASSTLASGTVSITSNFHSGEDVLAFTNTNTTTYGNIVASYNAATGVLTLTSSGATATIAQWQAAMRAVTWTDTAVTPNSATRTISFQVTDGSSNSSPVATRTVTVTAVDQTPIVSTSGGSAAFTAGDNTAPTPVVVDNGLTLADLDNTTFASATVAITGNFHSGEDALAFTNNNAGIYGNIVGSYNSATGILTLSSSGATATVAQWQAALRAVTWTDLAVTPNTATRTVGFTVNDGTKNSAVATRQITVTATDQTPILTTSGGSVAFTAGDNTPSTPVVIDSALTISDIDNTTLASATVAITGNFHSAEDVLAFTNTSGTTFGNIVASYNSGTGVLTLTSAGATATLSQWQAALRSVTWTDTAITPNTATRTISFSVNDGTKTSTAATRNVTVASTDQSPIATTSGPGTTYPLGTPGTPIAVDSGLILSDLDNATFSSATVAITGNFHSAEDVLAFTNTNSATFGNIVASYNGGTGVLTLTSAGATATLSQWQSALRAVTWADGATTPNTATRVISITVNDGIKNSATVTRSIAMSIPVPSVTGITAASDTGSSASDGITRNVQPTFIGTAQAGSTVTVYVDTVSVGSTTADGSGAWSFTPSSALSEGSHAISAMATLGSVNSVVSANVSVVIDTTAPAIPTGIALTAATDTGASTSDGVTSNPQPTFTGAATAGSLVTVYIDGSAVGTTTADGSGVWQYNVAGLLPDGPHTVRVTATDTAGNVSAATTPWIFTVDTAAPAIPTGIALTAATDTGASASDGVTANNQPTLTGAATAGSLVTVYIDGTAVGTATADGSGVWQYNVAAPLIDGAHTVSATATDTAGNVSAAATPRTFTVDTAAPAVPTGITLTAATDTGESASDGVTGNNQPTLTGAATAGSLVTVYIDGTAVGTTTADGSGVWQYNVAAPLADGAHTVSATATDTAGNVSATATPRSFTVDTAAPAIPTGIALTAATDTGASASDGVTSNPQPTLTGAATAGSLVTVYIDGTAVGTTTADGSGVWQYNVAAPLTDGAHTVSATATDTAGNVSAATTPRTFTVDTAAPAIPTGIALTAATDTGASASDGVTGNNQPTFTGAATAGSLVTVYIDGTAVGTTTADGSGVWQYNVAAPLIDGAHTVSATATDTAGNVSAAATPRSFTVDTAAPAIPTGIALTAATDTGASASDGVTSNPQPTLTGAATAGSLVTVYIDGTAVGTATADGSGVWQYNVAAPLADGAHTVSATATDTAGNVSAAATPRSFTVDTSAPAVPTGIALTAATDTGASGSDGVTANNQPTLTGAATAGSLVTVYIDGTAVGTTNADGSGVWQYNVATPLADGAHTVSATATDTAGNVSAATTPRSFTVDTTAPQVQAVTAQNTLTGAQGQVGYNISFTKPVQTLSANELQALVTGNVQANIVSVTQVNATTWQAVLSVQGTGTVTLGFVDSTIKDIAGNTLSGSQASVPVYQVAPAVTPVTPTTPSTVSPVVPGNSAPAIALQSPLSASMKGLFQEAAPSPIAPNIVLTALNGISTPALSLTGDGLLATGNATLPLTLSVTPAFGEFAVPGGSALPSYIGSITSSPTAALEVRADVGSVGVVSGQSFSVSLPAGTILTRESMANLSVTVRQSNGMPLPSWIKFDPATGRFSGQPPAGWKQPVSIEIRVVDKQGHSGTSHLELKVAGPREATPSASLQASPGKPGLDQQIAAQKTVFAGRLMTPEKQV
ncbi:Ig-like domain-containing protein [Phytobacter sp. SCO41]|nr:Ig-like domain-containing protein [Phytobacter sp. SCO41]